MSNLVILSGAGINMAVGHNVKGLKEISNFAYKSLSDNVYTILDPQLKSLFVPSSFDMILGTLMTLDVYIERFKNEAGRFLVNGDDVSKLLGQSQVRDSILASLDNITKQLTLTKDALLEVVAYYDATIDGLVQTHAKLQYFTTNYDGLFDHVLYGPEYHRSPDITDFWRTTKFDPTIDRKVEIAHLHGDLRYRPHKLNRYNKKASGWPVIVVGDNKMKREQIDGQKSLTFLHARFKESLALPDSVLAVIGFGFRPEDEHVAGSILEALEKKTIRRAFVYGPNDPAIIRHKDHLWVDANAVGLREFLAMLVP